VSGIYYYYYYYYYYYNYYLFAYFTYRPRFIFRRLLRLQACERKCRRPRIYHAIDDVITEIDIPTHPTDVSFEVFIDRQREYMIQAVREYSDRFGYVFIKLPLTTARAA